MYIFYMIYESKAVLLKI